MTPAARTAKRQRQHMRAMGRKRVAGAYSDDARADLAQACAFRAVQSAFAYLSLEQITAPPRAMKDAQLARQIAIRIIAVDLDIEQRQIVRMQSRQRTSIHFAMQTVERRLECETFAAAYRRMADEAVQRYGRQV